MLLAGFDLETTGRDPLTADIVEAGIYLYDPIARRTVGQWSELIYREGMQVPDEVTKVHGISHTFLTQHARDASAPALAIRLAELEERAVIWVGHNILDYDIPCYQAWAERIGFKPIQFTNVVDTLAHIEYPEGTASRRLSHLLCDLGRLPMQAHEAIADARDSVELLMAHGFEKTLLRSHSKRVRAVANVSFAMKDEAKKRRFRWDGESKLWWKPILLCDLAKEENPHYSVDCYPMAGALKDLKPEEVITGIGRSESNEQGRVDSIGVSDRIDSCTAQMPLIPTEEVTPHNAPF